MTIPRHVGRLLPAFIVLFIVSPLSARADAVRLRGGNMLTGVIVDATDELVILLHPDLGQVPIPSDAIATIHWAKADHAVVAGVSPDVSASGGTPDDGDAEDDTDSMPDGEEDEVKTYPWTIGVVLGGSITNNDEGEKWNINGRLRVSRTTPRFTTAFTASYLGKLTDGRVTDNEAAVIASNQWLHPDRPWFTFATGRYDFDEFRSWIHRVQIHGGVGYDLIKQRDTFRFFAVAGLGGRKDFGSIDEPTELEAQAGLGLEWTISNRQSLNATFNWYPELTGDSNRYAMLTDWTYLIDAESRLSFNVHLDYEYDTDPDPGFPNDNYSLTWGLQWDW